MNWWSKKCRRESKHEPYIVPFRGLCRSSHWLRDIRVLPKGIRGRDWNFHLSGTRYSKFEEHAPGCIDAYLSHRTLIREGLTSPIRYHQIYIDWNHFAPLQTYHCNGFCCFFKISRLDFDFIFGNSYRKPNSSPTLMPAYRISNAPSWIMSRFNDFLNIIPRIWNWISLNGAKFVECEFSAPKTERVVMSDTERLAGMRSPLRATRASALGRKLVGTQGERAVDSGWRPGLWNAKATAKKCQKGECCNE